MVDTGIFINYRREDSASYGVLLYMELSRHFGAELVFLDTMSIPAGANFAEHILDRVRQASVLLALIGPRWLTAAGTGVERRIDDPKDWIRQEIVEAFKAGVRVIPVLVDNARMPTEADLPEDLARLAVCQFRRLRHHDAAADLARLVTDLIGIGEDVPACPHSCWALSSCTFPRPASLRCWMRQ